MLLAVGSVILLLVVDQWIKISVKTSMMLGESIRVTDWFFIYFTENPGMAFGWEVVNKSVLTIFRLVASGLLAWLLWKAAKKKFSTGFLLCLAAILAGALGNIIDSVFYGVLFDHSYGQVATFVPVGDGYADWLHGKVVDMFYFPIINTVWPDWMPLVGGQELIFFQPIFNFADACISVGVICLILFYSRSFSILLSKDEQSKTDPVGSDDDTKES
ncbi:MAG: lipoprotein signal peptidase [Porphyromonas sp.]|nr:lipoprotein signal peptidase [Bacteroidales bacterium]MDY3100119.1 lipoprotein signal peptidase [Porphyromonas sp.]